MAKTSKSNKYVYNWGNKKADGAASKVLRSNSTGRNSKTAAGSALRQRRDRK